VTHKNFKGLMNYIIDGFNLAFKIDHISQTIKDGNTEKAITQLIYFVRSLCNKKNVKIVFVFDGRDVYQSKKVKHNGVDILFSKKPQTADDIIRNLIRKTKNKDTWTIVSSDNEIIYTAKDHGIKIIKSDDFKNIQTINSSERMLQKEKDMRNTNNIDIDYWRKIFNSGKNE